MPTSKAIPATESVHLMAEHALSYESSCLDILTALSNLLIGYLLQKNTGDLLCFHSGPPVWYVDLSHRANRSAKDRVTTSTQALPEQLVSPFRVGR
jgi:hypothetical protein